MTTPFICVALAFALAVVSHWPVIVAKWRLGYDNKSPRTQAGTLEGWGARAWAAEKNTLENFAAFAAAVVVAHLSGADPERSTLLSYVFVGARALYLPAYIGNVDYLRTALWFMGMLATAGLFVLAYVA